MENGLKRGNARTGQEGNTLLIVMDGNMEVHYISRFTFVYLPNFSC